MPSAALTNWRGDRTDRLSKIDLHSREVEALVSPDPAFLDETLRGYVLHLSAQFQGFCRDLYEEGARIWISANPAYLHFREDQLEILEGQGDGSTFRFE